MCWTFRRQRRRKCRADTEEQNRFWTVSDTCYVLRRTHEVQAGSVWTVQMMERMESLTDTGLCLQDLVSGVATSSSATSGSSESSVAHNHHQHANHHHHHEAVVPAVSSVSVSPAAAGIMSAGSAVLGLNHHHHVSAAVHDTVSHHHVPCAPTVLHHEPLEKLKRGEYHRHVKPAICWPVLASAVWQGLQR
jgi:hypothetical protein